LNVRPETLKLLEVNIGGKLLVIVLGSELLYLTSQAKAKKGKMNKWDYIKLKSFCTAKETANINKMKWKSTEWEKIFSTICQIRG